MAYRVLAVCPITTDRDEAAAFSREVHDMFVKAVHERTSMGVETVEYGLALSGYLAEIGDRASWPQYVGSGIDPDYRTPIFNALAFMDVEVNKEEATMASEALTVERMVAVQLPSGKFKRVTGLSLFADGSGTLLTDVPPPPPIVFPEDEPPPGGV
jgi:hypothetical protein